MVFIRVASAIIVIFAIVIIVNIVSTAYFGPLIVII